jgi:tRNA threonylcarbamoyladenosine biosynthesis protein TsaE
MPVDPNCTLFLPGEDDTARLGVGLAPRLGPGSTVLLAGPIGSGKTHLARALIRARMGKPREDVPSPSFTLVQTYPAEGVEIWHADLYRLNHPDEVLELGLDDAFRTAICLVEWPDRLGRDVPEGALLLRFEAQGEGRKVTASGAPALVAALERDWAPACAQGPDGT